ncbi:ParB/RepB/Spo0J family partition protein [Candidatus Uabimicrobium amorphum]|uniref:Chromosome partitioning protein ParB n=1 Tax=Uabimicrobium amorphum TaxID=2596890 RepID=A0A5S9IJR4_UABAM|nr:ParB/RepB/Spo0J family partition protein [Candidatus Uabimicrobium amorphum]BBM82736.1 chromosome partitioning protein ParB [Candidatus Uabimicrobium amorphum]
MAKKSGLGSNPLSWIQPTKQGISDSDSDSQIVDGKEIKVVEISKIKPDPNQPRKEINPHSADIKELAQSIKVHGFINFITVRSEEDVYIIVAGERRYTAAKIAGLKKIPVMIIDESKAPLDYALIQLEENLQRENLNTFDEADFYQRLQIEFGLQQKQIVERVGKSKAYISKMMKLAKIEPQVKEQAKEQAVPREVLFELSSLQKENQTEVWEKIKKNPTIAAVEKSKAGLTKKKPTKRKSKRPDAQLVFQALKKAVKKDNDAIFQFIPSTKVQKLLEEYGES